MSDSLHLLQLLQLNDSAFPTGAFSHSYGLETYTQAGIVYDVATLREFLEGRLLHGMVRFDLVLLREAMVAAGDIASIHRLDEYVSATITVRELREASMQVGRRFLRAARPLYGGEAARQYFDLVERKQCSGHFVLAYGVMLADMGIPLTPALLSYVSTFIMGQATAAVKLLNLGQTSIQALIAEMQLVIQAAVERSLGYTLDDCQMFMPALDIRAMQHEYLFRRLFIS